MLLIEFIGKSSSCWHYVFPETPAIRIDNLVTMGGSKWSTKPMVMIQIQGTIVSVQHLSKVFQVVYVLRHGRRVVLEIQFYSETYGEVLARSLGIL